MNDLTSKTARELNSMVPVAGKMELGGIEVGISRIRVKQIFAIIRLLKKVSTDAQEGNPDIVKLLDSGEKLISTMIMSLDEAEEDVYDLLATLVIPKEEDKELIDSYIKNGNMSLPEIKEELSIVYEAEKDVFGEIVKKVKGLAKVETKKK